MSQRNQEVTERELNVKQTRSDSFGIIFEFFDRNMRYYF